MVTGSLPTALNQRLSVISPPHFLLRALAALGELDLRRVLQIEGELRGGLVAIGRLHGRAAG